MEPMRDKQDFKRPVRKVQNGQMVDFKKTAGFSGLWERLTVFLTPQMSGYLMEPSRDIDD